MLTVRLKIFCKLWVKSAVRFCFSLSTRYTDNWKRNQQWNEREYANAQQLLNRSGVICMSEQWFLLLLLGGDVLHCLHWNHCIRTRLLMLISNVTVTVTVRRQEVVMCRTTKTVTSQFQFKDQQFSSGIIKKAALDFCCMKWFKFNNVHARFTKSPVFPFDRTQDSALVKQHWEL